MELHIKQLERSLPSGLVIAIHWMAIQKTDAIVALIHGVVDLIGDSQDSAFIPYDELTKEQVTIWLEDVVSVESLQAKLDAKIIDIQNPVSATGIPWIL